MDISNPRRILAVALAESQDHLSRVIKDLSGRYPEPSPGTGALAGTTHELELKTAYYNAQVPIWLDLIGGGEKKKKSGTETTGTTGTKGTTDKDNADSVEPDSVDIVSDSTPPSPSSTTSDPTFPQEWAAAFLADEAKEVRDALGGVVVVLDMGSPDSERQKQLVKHVGKLKDGLGASLRGAGEEEEEEEYLDSWDGVSLVVGVAGTPPSEDLLNSWDDACVAAGLEFVHVAPGQAATNEFGEKTGIARVLEALEANDWEAGGDGLDALGLDGDDDDDGDLGGDDDFGDFHDFDPESLDFGFDRADFAGLRQAIWEQQTSEVASPTEKKEVSLTSPTGTNKEASVTRARPDGPSTTPLTTAPGLKTSTSWPASPVSDSNTPTTNTFEDNFDNDDDDIGNIEEMMRKLLAARELGAGLPPDQRRRLAARAVGEVMKEL